MSLRSSAERWKKAVGHAFAMPSEKPLSDEQKEWLQKLAHKVCERNLTAPALLMLESLRPLGFVSSQAVVFFKPIVSLVFPPERCDEVAALLENRSALESLAEVIEECDRRKGRTQ